MLAHDILQKWDREVKILKDCSTTILDAFRKKNPTCLVLTMLSREGLSFKDCNQNLIWVGPCVVSETLCTSITMTHKSVPLLGFDEAVYNVTLKIVNSNTVFKKLKHEKKC